jgi:teichoic acid transport system permease protein
LELHNKKIKKVNIFLELVKNDFKSKFIGSQLGVLWAFSQPIVSVSIYWFIFEKGLKSQPINNFPYLLWLIAGICPWFYFNDAVNNASGSLLDYSYIVKKVKFPISIIPAIKIVSSLYVHLFFIAIVFICFLVYGKEINLYSVQMLYYTLCTVCFSLALSYLLSSLSVFFKDMIQIVNIILQYAMWLTPIMISIESFPIAIQSVLKWNPMYYIVEGYRDSIIRGIGFWMHPKYTAYFWLVTFATYKFGRYIFKKLSVHFADVL